MEVRNNSCALSPGCSWHPTMRRICTGRTPSDLCNTVTCNCNRLRREKLVLWNYADTERIRLAGAWGDDLPHDFQTHRIRPLEMGRTLHRPWFTKSRIMPPYKQ